MTYRFLPHTADTIIEIESPSVEGVFQDATTAARLLFAGELPGSAAETRNIALDGTGYAELLFRYLRELIVWFQMDTFIPTRCLTMNLDERRLVAQVQGERFTDGVHEPQPEVKAVTRHQLSFEQTATGWQAIVVLDL